ncbi:hypothetical protein ACHQM5_017337 [Ranunculus cassubicifolius]
MKLIFSVKSFKSLSKPTLSRVLFYSTKPQPLTPNAKKDTLSNRISSLSDPKISVVPILDQWVEQGKSIKKDELTEIIKRLKSFKNYRHALEISKWMADQSNFPPSAGDFALRLDLISRIHGIDQADKYFETIPEQFRVFPVYLSLLNSYAHGKNVEKAESLMQQMRDLGFARTTLAYNGLLTLYSRVGESEKLDTLLEEMKEKGIPPTKHTHTLQLINYAAIPDFERMEKVLDIMQVNSNYTMDWNCYAIAANAYIKASLIDKALEMLQKAEEAVTPRKRKFAYDYILTLYASAGRKEDVYRIWNKYKSTEKIYNTAYRCMLSSLLKLDDIEGAEKILEEWESGDTSYDFRVPNLVIAYYTKNGSLDKAEMLVNKAIENGNKPFANTWELLANGYVESNQIAKAVDAIKQGYMTRRVGWKPSREALAVCLGYLKEQGGAEKAEEFVRLLGAPGHMSIDDPARLLDYIYIFNKDPESGEVVAHNQDDEDTGILQKIVAT